MAELAEPASKTADAGAIRDLQRLLVLLVLMPTKTLGTGVAPNKDPPLYSQELLVLCRGRQEPKELTSRTSGVGAQLDVVLRPQRVPQVQRVVCRVAASVVDGAFVYKIKVVQMSFLPLRKEEYSHQGPTPEPISKRDNMFFN